MKYSLSSSLFNTLGIKFRTDLFFNLLRFLYYIFSIHQPALQAGYSGELMSRPITVVKEKQKNQASLFRLFICIVTHSTWIHCFCLANHKAEAHVQIIGPVCETDY